MLITVDYFECFRVSRISKLLVHSSRLRRIYLFEWTTVEVTLIEVVVIKAAVTDTLFILVKAVNLLGALSLNPDPWLDLVLAKYQAIGIVKFAM